MKCKKAKKVPNNYKYTNSKNPNNQFKAQQNLKINKNQLQIR